MEIWITRIALLWLDGSILLLAALVSVGPYALALTGVGLLVDWPRRQQGRPSKATTTATRFTLR